MGITLASTEEEYWTGWNEFLYLKRAQDGNDLYKTKSEHDKRYGIFRENFDKIIEHNNGGHSWTMGITQFSDMTADEFKSYAKCSGMRHKPAESVFDVPKGWNKTSASVDWVEKGAVTPVKNQGSCGSCWAFSTTGAIEGRSFIADGKLNSLSEQDLVDCSKQNSGCNGGLMDYGFEFVKGNGGLCSENDYPYVAYQEWRCRDQQCTKYDAISSYTDVAANTAALEAACNEGPVSIAIEADQSSFQQYNGGVLTSACGTQLDHGVLLVGYGTEGDIDYWKVKNSWGENWGEEGYIKLCRNCNANNGGGQCGILLSASYPTV